MTGDRKKANGENKSANFHVAIYRIHGNRLEYHYAITLAVLAAGGLIDDLPDVLADHPGAPKVSTPTIQQLGERIKRAIGEMQGCLADVRVSFPTMRGVASYGLHRRPVAADLAGGSILTIHLNRTGKLTEIYSRPTAVNMAVKHAVFRDVGANNVH